MQGHNADASQLNPCELELYSFRLNLLDYAFKAIVALCFSFPIAYLHINVSCNKTECQNEYVMNVSGLEAEKCKT